MRIIAGNFRGMKLISPKGSAARPTSDRVRENLFNIIADRIRGARVLDAFAGTGAVGLEALSRGAARCVFVESDRKTAEVLRMNIEKTRQSENSRILCMRAVRAMGLLSDESESFDIVYIDPPYGANLVDGALERIARLGLLSKDGLIIAEAVNRAEIPSDLGFVLTKAKTYGGTTLSFIERDCGACPVLDTGPSPQ